MINADYMITGEKGGRGSGLEGFGGRAGADEVAVTVGAVDPPHRRPVLRTPVDARRVDGLLAAVRVGPVLDQGRGRVRRVRQRVVLAGPLPRADLVDLRPDRDHGVAEAVELGEVLALRRLDHQRARDGE